MTAAAAFSILVCYAISNIAALRLPRRAKLYTDAVPTLGAAGCAALACSLSGTVIANGAAMLAAGFVARWLVRLSRRGGDPSLDA